MSNITNYPNGVSSFGIPQVGAGIPPSTGPVLIVGTDERTTTPDSPTISEAVSSIAGQPVTEGWTILVQPGSYDESVTIPYALAGLSIVGLGGDHSVGISPSTAAATGMTVHASNVTLVNLDIAGESTAAYALRVTGNGFRAYNCKFEGVDTSGTGVLTGPGTDAQVTAHTAGHGGDAAFIGCEFAWNFNGVVFQGTDYGAATQQLFLGCRFHNNSNASMEEKHLAGGAVGLHFRNVEAVDCYFDNMEDGSSPTAFLLLNDSNSNTGTVSRCSFPTALAGGLNLVSTALHWVANFQTGGISTAQPS